MEGGQTEGHITGPKNKRVEFDGKKTDESGGVFWGRAGPKKGGGSATIWMEFVLYNGLMMDLLIRNM